MEREVLVRRFVHALVALAPIYYLLPDDLPYVGLRRWVLLVLLIAGIFAFEGLRLWKKFTVLGLRPHERDRLASHAWAAAGLVIVLWVVPEKDIASAAIVGWALVDPLMGEMRGRKMRSRSVVAVSAAAYFVLALALFALWNMRPIAEMAALCALGAAVAIPSEYLKVRFVDDDFMMSVAPAFAMLALSLAVASL